MNPWLIIGAGIFWVLSVGGAYVKGQTTGADRVIATQAKVNKAIDETREAAQQGAADAIAKLKPVNRTILQKVEREIREFPVLTDCKLPPSSLHLANQALTGEPSKPAAGK